MTENQTLLTIFLWNLCREYKENIGNLPRCHEVIFIPIHDTLRNFKIENEEELYKEIETKVIGWDTLESSYPNLILKSFHLFPAEKYPGPWEIGADNDCLIDSNGKAFLYIPKFCSVKCFSAMEDLRRLKSATTKGIMPPPKEVKKFVMPTGTFY